MDRLAARSENSGNPLRSVDAATSESSPVHGEPPGDLGLGNHSKPGLDSDEERFPRVLWKLLELNGSDFRPDSDGLPTSRDRLAIGDSRPEANNCGAAITNDHASVRTVRISRAIRSSDRNGFFRLVRHPRPYLHGGRDAVPIRSHTGAARIKRIPTSQNFNRRVSCSRRAGWEATAWPKNGELRLPI